jgi:branched-chain amino acid transport system ATP-binding protein
MEKSDNVKLKIENISLRFGGVQALSGVSLDLREREILGVIGPNGAGKTSLINSISGFYRPQEGDIYFEGKKITRLAPDKIAELGISRTFQQIELYTGLTALDNLMAARHVRMHTNFLDGAIFLGRAQREEVQHRRVVEDIIDLLEIEGIRKKVVGALPYGQRKRVELGRALALEPKLLLLDEPMAGMNAEEKEDMARFILDVYDEKNIPIILIEHDMGVVMDICDRLVVLEFGRKIAEGTPDEIKMNQQVVKAYLGGD